MKPIFGIKRQSLAQCAALILLGSASLIPVSSAQNTESILKTSSGVPYVSGGVGLDSIDRLDALASQFNLKLVFALNTGVYLSDVKVTVADARGTTLLDTQSQGPWLMTKLPAGNYQIAATVAGVTARRNVAIGGARLSTVDFRWASE